MATNFEQISHILDEAKIGFVFDDENQVLQSVWTHQEMPVTLLVFLLEDGELLQIRAPALLTATDDATKPLLFRAMLQMAYETRLVQFEYDPTDGEVSTCIDIALEDAELTAEQLLHCCSLLLGVSFKAKARLETILETGHDPALDGGDVDSEEAKSRQSQLDAMAELARRMRSGSKGDA